jgi:ornithine carbamoyltransferase
MTELGGHAIYLDARTSQLSIADFRDEIRAIMRFGQVLMFRSLRAEGVELAASFNQIPVIDALSEKYHPCQALGDMLTMIENTKGGLKNLKKVAWLGIENNVSNTLKLLCAKLGVEISIISPEANPASVDKELNKLADATGKVLYTKDLALGLRGAQFVHTDTWIDMEFFQNGQAVPSFKKELARRVKVFMPYQLNVATIKKYAPIAKIMHCMACHIGYEITREAVDHKNSIIFDQAENRMHIQKAIIMWLLK